MTISGFTGILKRDIDGGDTDILEHDMKQIQSAVNTMSSLLEDLLEMSRVGRIINEPEMLSLGDLANEAVKAVQFQAAENGVEIEISPDLPMIYGDRVRLGEVLQNLVENAIKFRGDQPRPKVKIGSRDETKEVVCYVEDNGIGIESDYHEKIFGLFERLDPRIDGTGIGLALSRRIIEMHGGKIWVESEGTGKGSTYYFSIPKPGVDR